LSLQQALSLALEHSLEIALGRSQVDSLRAEAEEAAAGGRLKVAVGAYLTTGNRAMIFSAAPGVQPGYLVQLPPPGALNLNLMAMYPLFTGGLFQSRLAAAREAQKAGLALAALRLRETARDVRRAYYQVLRVRARQDAARWEQAQQAELLRLAQMAYRLGRVALFVVLRAQAEEAAAQQKILKATADGVEAEAGLKVAMGVAMTSNFSYPSAADLPLPPGPLEQDLEESLSSRADLIAARHAIVEQDWRLAAALAEYSPQVYLVGMAEAMKADPFRATSLEGGYQVGLVVSWPLYDGGERGAREERARASQRTASLQLQRLELQATAEVVTARARLEAARASAELAGQEVAQTTEDLRIAQLRFAVGRAIHRDVLDSLQAAARARADWLEAIYESNRAHAELLYAVGRF